MISGDSNKIRIYICDDEQLWIDKAHDITDNYFKDKKEVEFTCFDNSNSLMEKLMVKKEYPDIIILDIDMPSMSGFETAKQIKEEYPDTLLMFFTVHEQYVFDAFQFQPFRYIRKTNAQRELELALTSAIQVLDKRLPKSVTLKTNNKTIIVDIKNIMYFEIDGRKCRINLSDGNSILVRKGIKELLNEINSPDFVLLHSGAAANIEYIKDYSATDVTMSNNKCFPVSRRHIKSVRHSIINYWGKQI